MTSLPHLFTPFLSTSHYLLHWGIALAPGKHGPPGDRQNARNFIVARECGGSDAAAALALRVAEGTAIAFDVGAAAAAGKARSSGL